MPVEQPRVTTRNVTSGRGDMTSATANRMVGRRTARANVLDISDASHDQKANHLNANSVQTSKHKSNNLTSSSNTTTTVATMRPLEPRREFPFKNLSQNAMAKKSITSETSKFPEKLSLSGKNTVCH